MTGDTAIVRLLRRDRAVVVVALIAAIVLAWSYLLLGTGPQTSMAMGGS